MGRQASCWIKRLQYPVSFIGSRGSSHTTCPCQQSHIPSVHDNNMSCHNHAPMIHAFFLFPMHSFLHVSQLYVFLSSLRLTWLTDPALVTLVYPNWMQYAPRVLQEATLLDGVDVGVRGNSRRFSKTSSYPPCCHYAFNFFYPYFPTMSLLSGHGDTHTPMTGSCPEIRLLSS